MYWLLIGLGFPPLTLFTVGLYAVSPPKWATIQKFSLCFTYFSIVTVFLGLALLFFGEGNGNPLQYTSLENPRDRGAWWAAIYGVIQSQT